jgi:class 3 adenylate cyclase
MVNLLYNPKKGFKLLLLIFTVFLLPVIIANLIITGKVSAVIKLANEPGFLAQYPIVAFFAFVVLVVFVLLITLRARDMPLSHEEEYIQIEKKSSNTANREDGTEEHTSHRGVFLAYPSIKAEHSLVLHGVKQGATIVVVHPKNLHDLKNKLENTAFNALTEFIEKQAIMEIEQNRGCAKKITEHSLMGIFSPATRQFKHEMAGVKAALNIRNALEGYNRKLKDKLEYGIGINTGELIISANRAMQYTDMGNAIALAKKVADIAKNDVYATKNSYSRVMQEVQGNSARKINTINGAIELYSVKSIGTREAYKSYINDVLKRIK